MTDPRVEQRVRFGQPFDRLTRVSTFQCGFSVGDLGVGLRFGLEFRAQAGHQRPGSSGRARFDEHPCREKPDLHGLAINQGLIGGGNGGRLLLT